MSVPVSIGTATLYLGDCMDIMPTLPPVDHVITDPPYEAHMHDAKTGKVNGRGRKARGAARRIRTDGHANPPPVDFETIGDLRFPVARAITAIASKWALTFCTPEGVAAWRDAYEAAGAKYKRACHWVKPDSAPQFNGQGPAMGAEMFTAVWCGPGFAHWNGGGKRNIWTHLCQPPDRDGRHPTEKPLALMGALICDFTSVGETILDPFMGSGSTGVAAMRHGRPFLGIERDPKYFEIAVERIEAESRAPRLFDEAPKPKQLGLEAAE